MKLDEAIAHCNEKAKEQRTQAELSEYTDLNYRASACVECAKEHEQLAEWLTELQERRQADEWILVGKRLPDFDEEVLVCYRTQGGMSQMVSYRMDNGHWWGLSVMCCKPVAWKPLGKPYKRPYTRKEKNNG